MKEKCEYDCRACTNRYTPVCAECNSIESPGGKISRPTMYTERAEGVACAGDAINDLKGCIMSALTRGASVPTATVMVYNKLLEKEKRKEGEKSGEAQRKL